MPPPASVPPPAPGQPGYGAPAGHGYAQPGPYGTQPGSYGGYPAAPPRSRARTWLGIIAGLVAMAVVIAGVSAFILGKSKKWVLTAPRTVAGMSRDTSPAAQLAFGGTVTEFRADLTRLPGYGRLTSTVSGVYTLGPDRDVGFIGFNGTFNVQVMLKSAHGFRVQNVSPGPHGGTAECGVSGSAAICQWSTGTTVGIVLLLPGVLPGGGPGTESVTAAGDLMIKVRDSAEQPAR